MGTDAEPTYEATVEVERRRIAAMVLYLGLGAGLVGLGAMSFHLLKIGAAVLMAGGMFFLRAATKLAGRGFVPARLAIDPTSITLTDRESGTELERVSRGEITSGGFLPERRGGKVILLGEHGEERLSLRVREPEEGTRILETLGLDATSHRSTFEGVFPMKPLTRSALLLATIGGGAAAFFSGLGPLPFLVMLVAIATLFAWPTTIEIASDGVVVKSLFGSRYVRYRDVVAIERERGSIAATLVLRDGKRQVVPAVSRAGAPGAVGLERNALLLERMQNAWIAQRGGNGGDAAAMIARGGRRLGDWVDALRALRSGSDYRAAAMQPEKLVAVVEDAAAPDDARVAAAYLLANGDDAMRERVRVAAESTASPKLRIALGDVTNDALAERALAEVAEEEDAGLISRRRSP